MRFKLKFDEFFKYMSKGFFTVFGYSVKTEFELFKLPKRVDVIILQQRAKTKTSKDFKVFDYFKAHNIISFKSFKDNFSETDILELVIYLTGYINAEKSAQMGNCTATLIVTKIPARIRRMPGFAKLDAGKYILDMNLFRLYLVNVNELAIVGYDAYFLLGYGSSTRLHSLAEKIHKNATKAIEKKILDKLRELFYIRVKSFEDESVWEKYMPRILEADVTDMVKPYYDKGLEEGKKAGILEGKLEGKLENARSIARNLLKMNLPLNQISQATGLSATELENLK